MRLCFAPPQPSLVFSLGKAAVSPVITGCVFEVSGLLCVYTWLLSVWKKKATRSPPACLPACLACSVWVCVAEGRQWLVSLLSGALPRPCLSVCLPVCFSLPACLSVFLCHLAAAARWALVVSVLVQGFKMTLVWGSWQRQVRTLFIISVNMLCCGIAES